MLRCAHVQRARTIKELATSASSHARSALRFILEAASYGVGRAVGTQVKKRVRFDVRWHCSAVHSVVLWLRARGNLDSFTLLRSRQMAAVAIAQVRDTVDDIVRQFFNRAGYDNMHKPMCSRTSSASPMTWSASLHISDDNGDTSASFGHPMAVLMYTRQVQ